MSKEMKNLTGKFESEKQAHSAVEKKLKAEEAEFKKKEKASDERIKNALDALK